MGYLGSTAVVYVDYQYLKVYNMDIEEENYWLGYIDAKVEDLGKTRTHYPSKAELVAYRSRLLQEHINNKFTEES